VHPTGSVESTTNAVSFAIPRAVSFAVPVAVSFAVPITV
jgi:hypothetical protein